MNPRPIPMLGVVPRLVPRLALVLAVCAGACTSDALGTTAADARPAAVQSAAVQPAGEPAAARSAAVAGALRTEVPVLRLLTGHMEFLASDDLGGRETGTAFSRVTCQYVASAYRAAGVSPGADDGTYFQHYPLEAQRLVRDSARLAVTRDGVTRELALLDDWAISGYGSEGVALESGAVFAGYGIVSERGGVDDYAGLDVSGRLVVTLSGRPPGRDDLRVDGNWRSKRSAARDRGALGLVQLVLGDDPGTRQIIDSVRERIESPSMRMVVEEPVEPFPVITILGPAARELALAAGVSLPEPSAGGEVSRPATAAPVELPGLRFAVAAQVLTERTEAANVLGVIRGSDPTLDDEYVIVSAHNDHIGSLPDGRVNNGADDNASGTSVLMTTAAVLSNGPPLRRSVLFLSVSGEEKGLLGSEWWCEHPSVPLKQVVADINVDMVGRNDPYAVGATPSPGHPHYNTLVQRAVELAKSAGMEVTWTAPKDSDDLVDNYYARSDHYNFAQHDIPVVFFFSGIHEDYHKPTDELGKIQIDKLERMVQLLTLLVRDTADGNERPHALQLKDR